MRTISLRSAQLSFAPETFAMKFASDVFFKFPESHQRCFVALLAFLYKISLQAETNKMTAENLAICFAPTILKPPEDCDPMTAMKNVQPAIKAITLLISGYRETFAEFVDWSYGVLKIDDPRIVKRENKLLYGRAAEVEKEERASLEVNGFVKVVSKGPQKPVLDLDLDVDLDLPVPVPVPGGGGEEQGGGQGGEQKKKEAISKPPMLSQTSSTLSH